MLSATRLKIRLLRPTVPPALLSGLFLLLALCTAPTTVAAATPVEQIRNACVEAVQQGLVREKSYATVSSDVSLIEPGLAKVTVTFQARVLIGVKVKNTPATCVVTGETPAEFKVCDLTIYAGQNISPQGDLCDGSVRKIISDLEGAQGAFANWRMKWSKKNMGPRPAAYQFTPASPSTASGAAEACQGALAQYISGSLQTTTVEADAPKGNVAFLEGKAGAQFVKCTVANPEANPSVCALRITNHKIPYKGEVNPENQLHSFNPLSRCHTEEKSWYAPLASYYLSLSED